VAFEIAAKLAQGIHRLTIRLPTKTEDPTSAAMLARSGMGLSPDTPILHLTNVLERNGVLILALPMSIETLDAFSSWAGQDPRWPVIAFVSGKPGDRLRFSIAHELGHLVMHQSPRSSFAELERDANRFAAEFLLPDQAMRQEITTPITLSSLTQLKRRWLVSTQALIRRAYDLELATERQYRYLMQQLSQRGWRIREPEEFEIAIEKPRLLLKMAEVLYGAPRPDYTEMAMDMKLSVPVVRSILDLYQSRGSLPQRADDGAKRVGKVIPFRPERE
jgi:Zn-dependent peptidase ImmA (M78 family)